MDQHLLAENPMRAPKGGLAIIRTTQPVSIYEVIEDHQETKGIYKWYFFKNGDGVIEHYTLRCHHLFSTDIDTADESQVYKFMDEAWYWFVAYMKWEDNIDNL